MRTKGLENLTLTKHIEGRRSRGHQCATFIKNLCKWMIEKKVGGMVIIKR